jgi:outer membrane protein OmpA-like peptidoglycan-associated protein
MHLLISFSAVIATISIATTAYAQSDTTLILTGNQPAGSYYLTPAQGSSEFLRSLVGSGRSTPTRLRLLGTRFPMQDDDSLEIRFAVLDSSGNAIAGLDNAAVRWELTMTTTDGTVFRTPLVPELRNDIWITASLRIALVLEQSVLSLPYQDVINRSLDTLIEVLGPRDRLALIGAGVQPRTLIPMSRRDSISRLSGVVAAQLPPGGVNRLTYGMVAALEECSPSAMIVITACDDHASLDVFASDVIESAVRTGTRIYCIAVGDYAIETAGLERVAVSTGGKFYRLYMPTREQIQAILVEIIRGEQVASTASLRLPASMHSATAQGYTLSLGCITWQDTLSDTLTVPATSSLTPSRQMIAVFPPQSSTLDPSSRPVVEALAELLRANPTQNIELVGHAYNEGSPRQHVMLSVERARAIKNALVAAGINAKRIHLRAMGDLKPVYPFAQSPAELASNRRVELRWLDPSLLPFELVVGYTYSEHEALTMLDQWQRRGYRAYIEDVLINGQLGFRIKLWGYSSRQQAQAAARELARRYGTSITVE